MSIILAIETSVPNASLALSVAGENIATQEFESHRKQNQLLFPALQSLLPKLNGATPDLIIVGAGPGSYSGSRIAIAAAQGLGITYQCPVITLCSYLATPTALSNDITYAVGDARRGSYFIAKVDSSSADFSPQLMELDAFESQTAELTDPLICFEDTLTITKATQETPSAQGLIQAWLKLPVAEQAKLRQDPPQPLYLRAPFITKAKPGHPLLRKK